MNIFRSLIFNKPSRIFFLLILLVFIILSFLLLIKMPPVWTDEAMYADIVNNFIHQGRLGSDFWQNSYPGLKSFALWNPPLFFYFITFWTKIFGLSIIYQRLLSVVISIFFLMTFYFFYESSVIKKNSFIFAASLIALITDFTFTQSTRISRPEIFVILFGFLSLYFFYNSHFKKNTKNLKNLWLILSGFMAGIAILFHFVGIFFFIAIIIYLFIISRSKTFKIQAYIFFIIFFTLPIIFWTFSILPHLSILKEQLILSFIGKTKDISWPLIILRNGNFFEKSLYLSYIIFSLYFVITSFIKKNKENIFISIILILSWCVSIFGRMHWYSAYPIPIIYLALLKTSLTKKNIKLLSFFIAAILLLNLYITLNTINNLRGKRYSYDRFVSKILRIIPPNKSIFLSSIPEPYFGIKVRRPKTIFYQSPAWNISYENYLKILNDTDYIIFTDSNDKNIDNNILLRYINKNALTFNKIQEPLQYRAIIIELKPRDKRSNAL